MTGLQRTLAVVSLVAAVALGVLLLRHPSEAQALPRPFTVMRAGQYFGTRTTVPGRSLMTGIAWFGGNQLDKLRGACRDEDGLQRWGWTRHDGVSYGSQFLGDRANGVDITTEFVKANTSDFDGPVAWIVRVRGTRATKAPRKLRDVTLMLHAFAEAGALTLSGRGDKGVEGDVVVKGTDAGTGEPFTLAWLDNEDNKAPSAKLLTRLGNVGVNTAPEHHALRKTHYLGGYADTDTQWRLKDMVSAPLTRSLQAVAQQVIDAKQNVQAKVPQMRPVLPNTIDSDTNTVVLQRAFKLPFQVDIVFVPHAGADALQQARDLSSQFADVAAQRRAQFDEAFESRFGGESSGMSPEQVETAKAAMSNLLGGMTYFHGSSIVRTPDKKKPFLGPEHELFTAVPSRSFFPRGFLWDEGFHQLVVSRWNPVLTRSVLLSWLRSMDDDGWIAREQILGSEARERVPEQFRVQKPDVANPPTLLLAIQELVRQYHASGVDKQDAAALLKVDADGSTSAATVSEELKFFREAFPLMRRQFEWLKRTQRGRDGGFYWRGCKGEHCLASGLDDYPRGDIPSRYDQHVDLLSWLILAARLLADIAPSVGEDPTPFAADAESMAQHLEAHWNEDVGVFCDIGFMVRRRRPGESKPKGASQQVCNIGYVTFFPLLLRLVPPDSPRLPRMLEVLGDPQHTWSKFGVRSLAKSHKKFGAGENYWRGAVWINCNYLALQALRHYSHVEGPAQERAAELRDELRANLVRTINDQYQAKGFLYESYDSDDGHGRGTHPFTGWTSLVVLMLADVY